MPRVRGHELLVTAAKSFNMTGLDVGVRVHAWSREALRSRSSAAGFEVRTTLTPRRGVALVLASRGTHRLLPSRDK